MKFLAHVTATQNLDTFQGAAHQPGSTEQLFVDSRTIVEPLFKIVEVNNPINGLECGIIEAAFWQAPEQRHLTALESGPEAPARAGLLTLVAFSRGLSVTGAFAAAETLAAVLGAGIRFKIVQSHSSGRGRRRAFNPNLLSTNLENFILRSKRCKCVQGGFHDISGIVGAKGFGEDVANSRSFDDGAHSAPCDHAGSRRCGLKQHAAASKLTEDFVRNGIFVDGDVDHSLLGRFGGFANGLADFVGLAETNADATTVIAGNDQRTKAETPTTLDDLRAAVDEDHLLDRFLWFLLERFRIGGSVLRFSLNGHSGLEFETFFAGGIGESLYFAMIFEAATIEDDPLDLF
jgi:hypothetical protein